MLFDCFVANLQFVTNLLVRHAADDLPNDLHLTLRERKLPLDAKSGSGQRAGELPQFGACPQRLSLRYCFDGANEFLGRTGFGKTPAGTPRNRAGDPHWVVVTRVQQQWKLWLVQSDATQRA